MSRGETTSFETYGKWKKFKLTFNSVTLVKTSRLIFSLAMACVQIFGKGSRNASTYLILLNFMAAPKAIQTSVSINVLDI